MSYEDPRGLIRALLDARQITLEPPTIETPSEWAERNLELPMGRTSKPGELKLFPFQRGILDAMAARGNEIVVVKKSARVGYTQLVALATAYHLNNSGAPILSVFPVDSDARKFERNYIRPLVNTNEILRKILPDMEEQLWHSKKTQVGSEVDFKGAHDYKTFRDYTVRFGSGDEIDASSWNNGAGEGDKIQLFFDRFETYDDGLMVLGSTPTLEGKSRIDKMYHRGDQRRRFVKCPHCGEMQILEWGGSDVPYGIKWPKDEPEEAYYVCRHNGCVIEEMHKPWMDEHGEWRPTAVGEPGVVSFHISALYSQLGKAKWGRLAQEFVEASRLARTGDKSRLQAFTNTKLGECWRDLEAEKGLRKPHELAAMCEIYQAPVPLGVLFTTAGIDQQSGLVGSGGYREVSIYGWGVREKPYLIAHYVIPHPIEGQAASQALAEILMRKYRGEDGRDHVIQAACIDTGGHYSQAAVDFCASWRQRTKLAERWYPIKGWGSDGKRDTKIWKTPIGSGAKIYSVEVNRCKDITFNKIHGSDRDDLIVFPMTALPDSVQIDADFFDGLTKEKKEYLPGQSHPIWEKGVKGNEPWDCLQYAFAALQALKTLPPPNQFIAMLDGPMKAPRPTTAPDQDAKPATSAQQVSAGQGVAVKKRKAKFGISRASW